MHVLQKRSRMQADNRLPRYQRLRDELASKIAARRWQPGEAIPTEQELAQSFDLAVGTVRKAIDLLVAEGLLERYQGRGTFVRRASCVPDGRAIGGKSCGWLRSGKVSGGRKSAVGDHSR